jgi:DNA-binding IclR family transcriptional regulator
VFLEENRYHVPVIVSTGRILQYLSSYENRKSSLSEISQALNISKSTCFRILRTLEDMNYVSYDKQSKRYSLGAYLVVLGSRALEQLDYLTLGKKYLQKITEETGLTSAIVQKIGDENVVYVTKEEADSAVRISVAVGKQFHITQISFGKCFLAFTSEKERMAILSKGLVKLTDNTITDVDEYLEELNRVRKQGYAISREEYIVGINAVSAPVFRPDGEVLMVLCCLGIAAHFPEEKMHEVGQMLRDAGKELTSHLNGRMPETIET